MTGSNDPWTSALRIKRNSAISPAWNFVNRSSNPVIFFTERASSSFRLRSFTIARASLSDSHTWNKSPALGSSFKPKTRAGCDGPAASICLFMKSNIAFIFPLAFPAAIASPFNNVPFWIRRVAIIPLLLSTSATMTVPMTVPFGFARILLLSAMSRIASSRSSIPVFFFAETGTIIVSPSHSSEISPASATCCLT